jgi:transposase
VNLAVRGYRGSSVSLLLAITSTGERRAAIESGGVNAATVAHFIRTHLRDTTKRFLLMDNASIHKTRDVLDACAEVGLAPLFLAPYSPFYAPVEMCFHVLKHGLRATPVRRAGADFRDGLLHDVAHLSTQAMANMFRKCWGRVRARAAAPTGA